MSCPTTTTSGGVTTSTPPTSAGGGGGVAVTMPSIDLNALAMYPAVIGWGVLGTVIALALIFLGAFLTKTDFITQWWSVFIWTSLLILITVLIVINISYASALKGMTMCSATKTSFVDSALGTLAAISILLFYIIQYEFGTNQDTDTYLKLMVHVNLLGSLMTLCMVTMLQIHNLTV